MCVYKQDGRLPKSLNRLGTRIIRSYGDTNIGPHSPPFPVANNRTQPTVTFQHPAQHPHSTKNI